MDDPGDDHPRTCVQATGPPRVFDRRLLLWFLTIAMLVALATTALFFLRHEQPRPRPAGGSSPPQRDAVPAALKSTRVTWTLPCVAAAGHNAWSA